MSQTNGVLIHLEGLTKVFVTEQLAQGDGLHAGPRRVERLS
jgi:hypothetical protein